MKRIRKIAVSSMCLGMLLVVLSARADNAKVLLVAAQVPAGKTKVKPPEVLDLPPAEVNTAPKFEPSIPSTEPGVEVPFRPTMDPDVYATLKEMAEQEKGLEAPMPGGLGEAAPTIILQNFEGVNQPQAFGPPGGFFPPDTHGAAGRTQFVEVVNTAIAVYDRETGTELRRLSLNSFFGYPTPPAGQFLFDPRAAYDRDQDRWVVTATAFAESPSVQFFFIGVSTTGNATGAFFIQRINVRESPFNLNDFFDYPELGLDKDAVMVTANIFAPFPIGSRGADLLVFPKDRLYAGLSLTVPVFQELIGTLTPPIVLDTNPSSFLMANLPVTPFVVLYELTNSGDPSTINLADPFVVNVGNYRVPRSARQRDTTATLDTLDTRFVHASTQVGNSLFNVHTINVDTFPTPRWYEIDTAARSVIQRGVFFGRDTSDDWNASIVVNDVTDAFVTWSSSNALGSRDGNPPYFPQIRASSRLNTDPPGQIPPGVAVFESPTFLFQFRWGDYSAITLDPLDARCAWAVNEKVNAFFTWGSRFFSSCLQ